MARLRGNSFPPLGQLRGEMDRLFDDFFGAGRNIVRGAVYPAVNVWEGENEVFAEAELPGLKTEDLEIQVVGNELTIKGRRVDTAQQGVTYHRRERSTGEFARVVRLPVDVDADRVEATLRDGVLRLVLSKAAASRPRKINVSGG
jgi:HSP20 family protein